MPATKAELLIVGGSLAAMACAIRLRQLDYHPLVLEKSRFPRPKLCGEFLAPDALAMLERLGVMETVRQQAFGPVERAFYYHHQAASPLAFQMRWISRQHPYALAIPRERLDFLLAGHARALGVTVLEGRRVLSTVRADSTGFALQAEVRRGDKPEALEQYHAPVLVDASGRNGRLRLETQVSPAGSRYKRPVGIQCHVQIPRPLSALEPAEGTGADLRMYLFPGGYGGFQPLSESTGNVCMLVDGALARHARLPFAKFIAATMGQNPLAVNHLAGAKPLTDLLTTADINLDPIASPPWIQVGDARVTVDPFTGSGMAHALESGWLAAESIAEGLKTGKPYGVMLRDYHHRYARRFALRQRLLGRFRPLLESCRLQRICWPLLPPMAPMLARVFR